MKKLLYFGLCICACCALCFCAAFFSSVKAEETKTWGIETPQEFFNLFNGLVKSGDKVVLKKDIELPEYVVTNHIELATENATDFVNIEYQIIDIATRISELTETIISEEEYSEQLELFVDNMFQLQSQSEELKNELWGLQQKIADIIESETSFSTFVTDYVSLAEEYDSSKDVDNTTGDKYKELTSLLSEYTNNVDSKIKEIVENESDFLEVGTLRLFELLGSLLGTLKELLECEQLYIEAADEDKEELKNIIEEDKQTLDAIIHNDLVACITGVQMYADKLQSCVDETKILVNQNVFLGDNILERNLTGVEIDGNGHTIVTSFPLFNTIGSGAVVKNLNVIASKNFEYNVENSDISNFGLLACDVQGGSVFNVSASCEIASKLATADELSENNYGSLNLSFNGSASIGGMFGQLRDGAVVQNCYIQTKLNVAQNYASANSTVIGGFVGNVENALITNCYVVPVDTQLISVELKNSNLPVIIGGFAGKVNHNIQSCINVFTGGTLPYFTQITNKVVGKIFGELGNVINPHNSIKISKCYTYNTAQSFELCGQKTNSSTVDIGTIEASYLKSILNFSENAKVGDALIWDSLYEWDVAQTWCKKTADAEEETTTNPWTVVEKWNHQNYDFPVLQRFQIFQVVINNSNPLQVDLSLLDINGEPLTEQNFVYGTTVYLNIEIKKDYLPYKVIDQLKFNNTTVNLENPITGLSKTETPVPIVISAETAGVYDVTTKNISYYLKVISEDYSMGVVRHTGALSTITEGVLSLIELDSDLSFTASSESVSYQPAGWVWVDENNPATSQEEHSTDYKYRLFKGRSENFVQKDVLSAQSTMSINLIMPSDDKKTENQEKVHLFLTQENLEEKIVANNGGVPYKIEDGKVIFTVKALFSDNVKKLKVYVNALSDVCRVLISESEADIDYDDGTTFNLDVTAGIYVKVRLEINENYKDKYTFVRWSCLSGEYDINDLIDENNCNANSPEIYIKIQENIELFAELESAEKQKANLVWLWWVLGGVGGAGLITLIVVALVRKKNNESFVRYY